MTTKSSISNHLKADTIYNTGHMIPITPTKAMKMGNTMIITAILMEVQATKIM